ncbi:MAG: hypothetical protein J6W40_03950 [Alphaproteobacteria bacterium]|nr:hypothetical protein [Alphaproteobacteria bacterium]
MKKNLLVASVVLLSTGIAFAKPIDFNTIITWNSDVISQALTRAGFLGTSGAAWDVRVTHERILDALVKKHSFSLRDATQVCMDKCNLSDFLKNGRGKSGKKCPDLCSGFADALIAVNNEYAQTGGVSANSNGLVTRFANRTYKVYSRDRRYYAMTYYWDKDSMPKKYVRLCQPDAENLTYSADTVVFESATNNPIALLQEVGEDCAAGTEQLCAIDEKYERLDGYGFFEIIYKNCCSDDCSPIELIINGKK